MAFDHWCTPDWLAEIIGPVDTDPCSNPYSFIDAGVAHYGPHDPADRQLTVPGVEAPAAKNPYADGCDGLTLPWHGSVFVNPPYSNPGPWANRWAMGGCQHGPAMSSNAYYWLSEAGIGTKWMDVIFRHADVVLCFTRRLAFYDPRVKSHRKGARSGHVLAVRGLDPVSEERLIRRLSDIAVPLARQVAL